MNAICLCQDITIQAEEILTLKKELNLLLASHCGKTEKQVEDASDRDNYMSPDQAMAFGIIDEVLHPDAKKKS